MTARTLVIALALLIDPLGGLNDWRRLIYESSVPRRDPPYEVFSPRFCFLAPCLPLRVGPGSYNEKLRPQGFQPITANKLYLDSVSFTIVDLGFCWDEHPICVIREPDIQILNNGKIFTRGRLDD